MEKRNIVSAILLAVAVGFLLLDSHAAQAQSSVDRCYKESGDAAIAACTEVIRQDPKNATAYFNRGNVWAEKGDHDKAIADFNEAIRLDPKDVNAYNKRGDARLSKGDHDKAIADFSEAVRLDPSHELAKNNLKISLEHKAKQSPQVVTQSSQQQSAADRCEKEISDAKISACSEVIRHDSKDADAYFNRGFAWFTKGSFDKAIADYNEAIRLNSKYEFAKDYLKVALENKAKQTPPFVTQSSQQHTAVHLTQQSRLPACPQDQKLRYDNCFGTFTYPNGTKYVGEFKDGKFNGQGTGVHPDGKKYVGEFKDGKFNGQGTFTYPNGTKYVGEWNDDKINGRGTGTFPNGTKQVGEWKDGKLNGQGTLTSSDGKKFVGEWKDGKLNGQGSYTSSDGKKFVGKWKDGKLNGQGSYTSSDGKKYVGKFKDGKFNGERVLTSLAPSTKRLTRAQQQQALQDQQNAAIVQEVVLFVIGVGLSAAISAASSPRAPSPRAPAFNQRYQVQQTVPFRNCVGWPLC